MGTVTQNLHFQLICCGLWFHSFSLLSGSYLWFSSFLGFTESTLGFDGLCTCRCGDDVNAFFFNMEIQIDIKMFTIFACAGSPDILAVSPHAHFCFLFNYYLFYLFIYLFLDNHLSY